MKRWLFVLPIALVVLVGCGGGDAASPTTTGGNAAVGQIEMANFAFTPATITIPVGTSVTWTNTDSVQHTTTSVDDLWKSGNLAKDASFSFTFDTPGTYEFMCSIHNSMKGTITVTG
jgi:plastocyanin